MGLGFCLFKTSLSEAHREGVRFDTLAAHSLQSKQQSYQSPRVGISVISSAFSP
jgi:hypothetical protein